MTDSPVTFIVVLASDVPRKFTLEVVTLEGDIYLLPDPVPAGSSNLRHDLPASPGFPKGAKFRVRSGGACEPSFKTILTYDPDSLLSAYYTISADYPLTFSHISH